MSDTDAVGGDNGMAPVEASSIKAHAGTPVEERAARLEEGAAGLESNRRGNGLLGNERFLLIASATLVSVGVTLILLGWAGAANTTMIEGQIPYLISGGLLGVALATVGGMALFGHWLTAILRENRAQDALRRQENAALLEELRALRAVLANAEASQVRKGGTDGRSGGQRTKRPVRTQSRG